MTVIKHDPVKILATMIRFDPTNSALTFADLAHAANERISVDYITLAKRAILDAMRRLNDTT